MTYKEKYKILDLFDVLNISKSNYYKYYKIIDKDYEDYLLIKEIFDENYNTYGYRRIEKGLLQKYGIKMNHKKIHRIMKKYDIRPQYTRKPKNKRYKRIEENVKPNLVNRKFNVAYSNKVWSTDITYLIFKGKRAYLSTILDLYNREIVAYKISYKNDLKLVIDTLNLALKKRGNVQGLIIHSDQGHQYTSPQYQKICESNGITVSMSRKGTPIDDSPIESFHGILKKETLYNNNITSLKKYIELVENWIIFYNTKRIKNRD